MEVEGVQNISFFPSAAESAETEAGKLIEKKSIYNSEKTQKIKDKDEKYTWIMAEKAVENANSRVRSMGTTAKFEFNEEINRITITITDKSNNEIVKEIPSEDTQKMLEHIHTMTGMLMDTQA